MLVKERNFFKTLKISPTAANKLVSPLARGSLVLVSNAPEDLAETKLSNML